VSVLLVRHAKAGDREQWTSRDELRPLTKSGQRQAEGLVKQLSEYRISRVLSSPYTRCRQTVEPLARAHKLSVLDSDELAEGASIGEALEFIASLDDAVLCSHADVIAGVVLELAERRVPLRGALQWEKGSTWDLTMRGGAVVEGRYLPPPG
jgi:phosphohistidine phosphatase SixA